MAVRSLNTYFPHMSEIANKLVNIKVMKLRRVQMEVRRFRTPSLVKICKRL